MDGQEEILVVSNDVIKEHLKNQMSSLSLSQLKEILKHSEFKKRYLMEIDPNYKQIIPYIAVICEDKVLVYMRSGHSGERRLHQSYSIGIGGHINTKDNHENLLKIFFNAAIRKIKSEIGVEVTKDELEICCFINDDSNEVGKVHSGIGLILRKNDIDINMGELDIIVNRKFMDKDEVENVKEKFENWSQIFYSKHVKDLIK